MWFESSRIDYGAELDKAQSTPVTAAETGTTEGATEHSQENEYDQHQDKQEHEHQGEPRGGAEKIERSLKVGVGISTCLLKSIKKERPNLTAFVQDGHTQSAQNCRYASAEKTGDGAEPSPSARMNCDFRVAAAI